MFGVIVGSCEKVDNCAFSTKVVEIAIQDIINERVNGSAMINSQGATNIDTIFLMEERTRDVKFYSKKYNASVEEICIDRESKTELRFPNIVVNNFELKSKNLPYLTNRIFIEVSPVLKIKDGFIVNVFWSMEKRYCGGYTYEFKLENGDVVLVGREQSATC